MADSAELLRYWVWLSLVFGAGNAKAYTLLQHYERPDALCDALQSGCIHGLSAPEQQQCKSVTLGQADSLVYFCQNNQITLLPYSDERYPDLLREIYSPPILLTTQGNLDLLDSLCLTIVGTRHPSPYSVRVVQALVGALGPDNFTIVSGFANGIDTVAHTAALDAGIPTIAVLGCGINVNYPRENAQLRTRMTEVQHGLMVSEYLPGTQPIPANFPKRNRILSGLSQGTVVIEAAARSGSLVTAECAVEQGRNLFCVPPADLFDRRYAGVIPLLRDGAIPLFSHRDIFYEYYTSWPQRMTLEDGRVKPEDSLIFADATAQPAQEKAKHTPVMQTAQPVTPVATAPASEPVAQTIAEPQNDHLPDTDAERELVLWLRQNGDAHVNDLATALDMDLSAVLSMLTLLELDGYVESLFGKRYHAI